MCTSGMISAQGYWMCILILYVQLLSLPCRCPAAKCQRSQPGQAGGV